MIDVAKELGIKVTENSDDPGFFIVKDGVKRKVEIEELLSINFDC